MLSDEHGNFMQRDGGEDPLDEAAGGFTEDAPAKDIRYQKHKPENHTEDSFSGLLAGKS